MTFFIYSCITDPKQSCNAFSRSTSYGVVFLGERSGRGRYNSAYLSPNSLLFLSGPPTETLTDIDNEEEYVKDDSECLASYETENEEYKNLTMKLLSQLKLGTELTRTSLPAFFCEHRSLLQIIADAFRQPHLLLR